MQAELDEGDEASLLFRPCVYVNNLVDEVNNARRARLAHKRGEATSLRRHGSM